MKSKTKKIIMRIVAWTLVLAWMGVIFYLSSQPGAESDNTSGGIVDYILRILKIDISAMSAEEAENTFTTVNSIIRTIAHFTEYGILGAFIALLSFTYFTNVRAVFFTSLAASVAYAFSDELHQRFVPHRSSSIDDVAVDSFGALLGIVIICLILSLIIRRIRKKCEAKLK